MKERARYIDISKGLVILLMLFSHTMSGTGLVRTYISSFHMQFFFIACGILTARKYSYVSRPSIKNHVRKRAVQLGVPYLIFCTLLAAFYTCLNIAAKQSTHVMEYIKRILFLQGIDSLWFLPVYFLSELMMITFLCAKNGEKLAFGLSCFIILLLCVFPDNMPSVQVLRLLIKSLIGFVFICYGYEIEKRRLLERIPPVTALFLLICGAVLSHINGFSAVGSLEVGNGLLFFGNAVLTCTALLALCLVAEKSSSRLKLLSWFGMNTIVVLCTNNLLIEFVRLADYKLTGSFFLRTGLAGSVFFTILLVAMEIPLIKLAEGPLAFAFGKRTKKG